MAPRPAQCAIRRRPSSAPAARASSTAGGTARGGTGSRDTRRSASKRTGLFSKFFFYKKTGLGNGHNENSGKKPIVK